MDRRTFTLLLLAVALGKLPKSATAAPTCRECGQPIWRGSRAFLLDALPPMPEAELCLQCLAALDGSDYDLIPDGGPGMLVRMAGPNRLPGTAWMWAEDFRKCSAPELT